MKNPWKEKRVYTVKKPEELKRANSTKKTTVCKRAIMIQNQYHQDLYDILNAGLQGCPEALIFDPDECLALDWLVKNVTSIVNVGETHPQYESARGMISVLRKIGEYRTTSHAKIHLLETEVLRLRAELRIERGGNGGLN